MTPISRLLRRKRDADTPAERPLVVVVVLADTARTPHAEATPGGTLPHLDFELAIRLLEDDGKSAENTRKTYIGLRRYAAWLDGRPPTDRLLAEYLDALYDNGRAPPSAVTAVATVRRAVLLSARAGYELAEPPVGHLAAQRLERFRREGAGRGRGQAGALRWEDADRMCECAENAEDPRGIRDAALIGVASSALLRVSEASALDAGDVSFRDDGSAHLGIRRSKTDQHGAGGLCGPSCGGAAAKVDGHRRDRVRAAVPSRDRPPHRGNPAGTRRRPRGDQAPGSPGRDLAARVRALAARRRGAVAGGAQRVGGRDAEGGALEVAGDAGLLRAQPGGVPGRGGAAAGTRRREKVAERACNPRNGGARVDQRELIDYLSRYFADE